MKTMARLRLGLAIFGSMAAAIAAEPKTTQASAWENLFDGKTLAGWVQSGFEAEGMVRVANPYLGGEGRDDAGGECRLALGGHLRREGRPQGAGLDGGGHAATPGSCDLSCHW